MKDISLYESVPPLENNFTLKFRFYRNHSALLSHWHEHIELLYFVDGSCSFISDGESFYVRKGDLVVVNSTQIHSFTVEKTAEYFCMLIYPAFLSDVSFDGVLIKSLIRDDDYIKECFLQIEREQRRGGEGADMMLKSHTYALMAYLVRNYTLQRMSEREHEQHSAMLARVHSVTEYVAANYRSRITTSSLAEMCYISEGHFCRFFKKATGKSATEYINEFRVQKAAVLLSDTDESITAIAETVGFEDANYFSRTFKSIKGKSPREYRKSKRR